MKITRGKIAWIVCNVILASVFPLRILQFLDSAGVDSVSADTLLLLPLLDKYLSGQVSWKDLFLYPLINGHLSTIPLALMWVFSMLGGLRVYPILYFSLALGILRVALLFDAVTHASKKNWKWLFLPVLSAMVFAPSTVNGYEFELSAVQLGPSQFGLVLGAWALARFPGTWKSVAVASFSGIIAAWAHGSGMIVWPAFFLGMLLMGFRNKGQYALLVAMGALACAPYLYVSLASEKIFQSEEVQRLLMDPFFQGIGRNFIYGLKTSPLTLFNSALFLQALGWPLVVGYAPESAAFRGIVYGLLLLSGIFFFGCFANRRNSGAVSGILLVVFGVLLSWVVTSHRFGLMTWYATLFMPLYLGMACLAFSALLASEAPKWGKAWGATALGSMAWLIISSGQSLASKSSHALFRGPASAACIRHYDRAPTYCEPTFFWTSGYPTYFAHYIPFLEKNRLSVFSDRQRWTLQGDFFLGAVELHETKGIPDIQWVEGLEMRSSSVSSYAKLNLFLHSPNAVDWTLDLPENLRKAEFHSAIAISSSAPQGRDADGLRFKVYIAEDDGPFRAAFSWYLPPHSDRWVPFSIPIERYAGKRIKIRLGSSGLKNQINDWALYRFPYVDLELARGEGEQGFLRTADPRPLNTDLASNFPKPGAGDLVLGLSDLSRWELINGKFLKESSDGGPNLRIMGTAKLKYSGSLDVPLLDYSQLYFRLQVPYEVYPITPKIILRLNGPEGCQVAAEVPPLGDGKNHAYTYDLRLLELSQEARLTGIEVDFKRMAGSSSSRDIGFYDFQLISKVK